MKEYKSQSVITVHQMPTANKVLRMCPNMQVYMKMSPFKLYLSVFIYP